MYEEAAAERYRNEALRADFLSGNEETTDRVGDVEDYEADEREEIKIFDELDKSEVKFIIISQLRSQFTFIHKVSKFMISIMAANS